MHHLVGLKMTEKTNTDMLSVWREEHKEFNDTLKLLEVDWPQALVSIHCLADYLTDALTLDGHSIFDMCLCNALGAYENTRNGNDGLRLWHFIESLTWTAASALTGIRLKDPDHFEWAVVDGVPLHSWLRSRPKRMLYLAAGQIDVLYVVGHSTTKRLQKVVKARVATENVASTLEQVERANRYEQA